MSCLRNLSNDLRVVPDNAGKARQPQNPGTSAGLNPDSAVDSERGVVKTPDCSLSKFFWRRFAASIRLALFLTALTAAARSEAERIVFATEGLLLTP
jgi:hypothetical protein